jgi:hypothetical protein
LAPTALSRPSPAQPAQIYAWLEGRDILVVKADRRDALVILPIKLAIQIAAAAERAKDLS